MKTQSFRVFRLLLACVAGAACSVGVSDAQSQTTDPLPPMLRLPGTGEDPNKIDFTTMPILRGNHAIVSHGNMPWPFRNHNYVAFFQGRYWAMWSHGLRQEDFPEQHVQYSTSENGLAWAESKPIVGPSQEKDFRYIARGFWIRDGQLLALASHDESYDETGKKKLFGPSLELRSFIWDAATSSWKPHGVIQDNTINNFPPTLLPNGQWGMVRRSFDYKISMLVGGVASPFKWTDYPLNIPAGTGFRPDEPVLTCLPDGRILGLLRDGGDSRRIFRTLSLDNGRTWTEAVQSNFPDANSKFFTLQTSRGYFVLVSNPNPAPNQRVPLCLSVSDDGITYHSMTRLPVPTAPHDYLPRGGPRKAAGFQYPHAIEHDGKIQIVYSRDMKTLETIQVTLEEIELQMKPRVTVRAKQ